MSVLRRRLDREYAEAGVRKQVEAHPGIVGNSPPAMSLMVPRTSWVWEILPGVTKGGRFAKTLGSLVARKQAACDEAPQKAL